MLFKRIFKVNKKKKIPIAFREEHNGDSML
ncbi:hypothetical protein C7382_1127 [Porphyromonas loveana]|uniref:Uncharacterized protein n=1 Tax=Porphyromonas loveana TaxID=1884669 RepID=A0A2U1F928_9PORP|nr:hypothetical protein C7382_1127 [Porphyromonas loveana]